MDEAYKKWLKRIGIGFLLFILGFFLVKKGIDYKAMQDLAIEKAKEDQIKLEIMKKEQAEKEELEKKHAEEVKKLEEEARAKQQKIENDAKEHKKVLKKQAKEDPDEFARKFSKKFKVEYNKDK